ncbi:MAG TPA: hypothetical protein VHZ97_09340, partial [Pseudonocardiaceae bacterium]|nr:hypothetical protein [Pseudonocardiaceae bacterium]
MSVLLTAEPEVSPAPQQEPWLFELTVSEAAEIDDALTTLLKSGKSDFAASASDFPLPRVGRRLRNVVASLEDDPGFAMIRGIPVNGKTEEEVRRLYWGLGMHFGVPLVQNLNDASIVDIRDEGRAGRLRVHTSNQYIGFHMDS